MFKTEYSKLIAVLCQFYGVTEVQLAEDIVSESFLKAMKTWAHNGVPDNPKAWLRKVAVNKLKDYYKRSKLYREKILINLDVESEVLQSDNLSEDIIKDSQLKMIFVVCSPKISDKAKICLALRILCGFNINEIAKAFLSNTETINKILYRAKKSLNNQTELNSELSESDYNQRIDIVLRIIYLLFNEGYYSSLDEQSIRADICWESMRLGIILSNINLEKRTSVYALIALMCFHSSRLEARSDSSNEDLLFNDQDRSKWNKPLILQGEKYLKLSAEGNIISKYHIEATIAYWHTTDNDKKWDNILQLYNRLLTIEYSPLIAMNRTYALAKANSVSEALEQALKLELKTNNYYFCLLAELCKMKGDSENEIKYLNKALLYTDKQFEKKLINKKLLVASR